MPIIAQLRRIFTTPKDLIAQSPNDIYLNDVNDGEIYKRYTQFFTFEDQGFTFTINTDGIAVCSKSDLSIWPIYLVVNEFDLRIRFCLENVIMAAFSAGSKPSFNSFLIPIINELKKCEYGISLAQNQCSLKVFRFFLLFGVFDKPARCSVCTTKSVTGYHGCIKCLQKSIRIKTPKSIIF